MVRLQVNKLGVSELDSLIWHDLQIESDFAEQFKHRLREFRIEGGNTFVRANERGMWLSSGSLCSTP
jgi:hypothetical protein